MASVEEFDGELGLMQAFILRPYTLRWGEQSPDSDLQNFVRSLRANKLASENPAANRNSGLALHDDELSFGNDDVHNAAVPDAVISLGNDDGHDTAPQADVIALNQDVHNAAPPDAVVSLGKDEGHDTAPQIDVTSLNQDVRNAAPDSVSKENNIITVEPCDMHPSSEMNAGLDIADLYRHTMSLLTPHACARHRSLLRSRGLTLQALESNNVILHSPLREQMQHILSQSTPAPSMRQADHQHGSPTGGSVSVTPEKTAAIPTLLREAPPPTSGPNSTSDTSPQEQHRMLQDDITSPIQPYLREGGYIGEAMLLDTAEERVEWCNVKYLVPRPQLTQQQDLSSLEFDQLGAHPAASLSTVEPSQFGSQVSIVMGTEHHASQLQLPLPPEELVGRPVSLPGSERVAVHELQAPRSIHADGNPGQQQPTQLGQKRPAPSHEPESSPKHHKHSHSPGHTANGAAVSVQQQQAWLNFVERAVEDPQPHPALSQPSLNNQRNQSSSPQPKPASPTTYLAPSQLTSRPSFPSQPTPESPNICYLGSHVLRLSLGTTPAPKLSLLAEPSGGLPPRPSGKTPMQSRPTTHLPAFSRRAPDIRWPSTFIQGDSPREPAGLQNIQPALQAAAQQPRVSNGSALFHGTEVLIRPARTRCVVQQPPKSLAITSGWVSDDTDSEAAENMPSPPGATSAFVEVQFGDENAPCAGTQQATSSAEPACIPASTISRPSPHRSPLAPVTLLPDKSIPTPCDRIHTPTADPHSNTRSSTQQPPLDRLDSQQSDEQRDENKTGRKSRSGMRVRIREPEVAACPAASQPPHVTAVDASTQVTPFAPPIARSQHAHEHALYNSPAADTIPSNAHSHDEREPYPRFVHTPGHQFMHTPAPQPAPSHSPTPEGDAAGMCSTPAAGTTPTPEGDAAGMCTTPAAGPSQQDCPGDGHISDGSDQGGDCDAGCSGGGLEDAHGGNDSDKENAETAETQTGTLPSAHPQNHKRRHSGMMAGLVQAGAGGMEVTKSGRKRSKRQRHRPLVWYAGERQVFHRESNSALPTVKEIVFKTPNTCFPQSDPSKKNKRKSRTSK